jgi:ADP-ribosylglycohydrolase
MSKDEAMGMFMGLFVGDAMGAPLEFTKPNQGVLVTSMIGGGVHQVSKGEWTDDGAMLCVSLTHTFQKKDLMLQLFKKTLLNGKTQENSELEMKYLTLE